METVTSAVAVSVALATLPPDSPFTVDARAAADKVLDALSDADRERAAVLADRVWVLAPESSDADGRIRRSIERSLAERKAVKIVYRSADGEVTTRVVEPVILAGGSPWYLVAYCRLREAIRWFRFDRIEEADLTKQSYEPRPVGDIGTPPERARPAFG